MSYNRNPLKHNRFRRPDGSLDFSNFWPNRRKLEKQDEIDPEERSNAEVAQSISTIVNHMGQTKKHPQERNTNEVKVIRRNTTSYLSLNFGNGLLYACLVEAFSYLKGPMDMLQLYEQKYQTEVQKFGGEQLGRRRRDDYTDGEPRIPVPQQTP